VKGTAGASDAAEARREDVPRTQVDDPDKRRSGADGGTTEGQVMGDNDTTLTGCAFENIDIRPTNQLLVPGVRRLQPRARRPMTTSGAMFSSERSGKSSGFTP
jgi:hypothetical protein